MTREGDNISADEVDPLTEGDTQRAKLKPSPDKVQVASVRQRKVGPPASEFRIPVGDPFSVDAPVAAYRASADQVIAQGIKLNFGTRWCFGVLAELHGIYENDLDQAFDRITKSEGEFILDPDDLLLNVEENRDIISQVHARSVIIFGDYIDDKSQSKKRSLSFDERLAELEEFARTHAGIGVASYARILFPELEAEIGNSALGEQNRHVQNGALPTKAPGTWKTDKRSNETPPEFIQRVYGEWMGKGLTLADVRHRDEPLAQAYYYHLRKGRPIPEGFDLPTKPEQVSRQVSELTSAQPGASPSEILGDFTLREAERLRSAIRRRGSNQVDRSNS